MSAVLEPVFSQAVFAVNVLALMSTAAAHALVFGAPFQAPDAAPLALIRLLGGAAGVTHVNVVTPGRLP